MIDCDEDACVIDQALIDLVLTNSEGLLEGTTRLREKKIQGQVVGMSFTGISAGSLADQLGFQNGEVVVAVNGLPFRTPEEFVAVAAAIFDAEEVIVTTQKGNHTEEHVFIRN